jgi:hypothetical protein
METPGKILLLIANGSRKRRTPDLNALGKTHRIT